MPRKTLSREELIKLIRSVNNMASDVFDTESHDRWIHSNAYHTMNPHERGLSDAAEKRKRSLLSSVLLKHALKDILPADFRLMLLQKK